VAKFVILGARGMLGQQVAAEAHRANLNVVEITRSGEQPFNYSGGDLDSLALALELGPGDTLVNCVGWIPQKGTGDSERDKVSAYQLNAELIQGISAWRRKAGFTWIQILTDCVFLGDVGSYEEDDPKDAIDLYGLSKIAGEHFLDGAVAIRCSIVGPDNNSSAGLYSWFKSQAAHGFKIFGYKNAYWNGVSTLAFSQLAVGAHLDQSIEPSIYHWIPRDTVSKSDLLKMFSTGLDYDQTAIEDAILPNAVDRTLSTISPERNRKLWEIAGYPSVPTIQELCQEMIIRDKAKV
jgi:dTDP-4-dehydrorhamnose reductase